ncbi:MULTISPECIES: Na+/H+ antiporter NhaC family protein [Aliiglaciecola]|uniref:Na+/H+ antiporter NhaC family protein n=1 Tax=Aliiglaciecola TaxID=1406885 RepID=UPI001C09783A|nr:MULTISPECIES: Na+/H+ antiporter NhaC family protein [Aliiglaciecola]MBU2877536.1 sodium:proton antiporter [Aliiglaciecola lipolytica]MDO6711116.1 Na+/H+ antiporter NhaC family protein [Aliiglaciecola sp. 2_MG-2023]MDO6752030.1 Na+/H+ antiporter NhaC family protein [Aliiglaciecola sp. 1_MG-2023]
MHYNKLALYLFVLALFSAFYINTSVTPNWVEQQHSYPTYNNASGELVYTINNHQFEVKNIVDYQLSPLRQSALDQYGKPALSEQWVRMPDQQLVLLKTAFHFGIWSLLPAVIAISLCLLTKQPIPALLGGTIIGALMLGRYDITDKVLLPSIASDSAATIVLLYLWLLGGLMGVWTRTGAAQAFAQAMTRHFVKGPRSAKLITWILGVFFFQGGTISTVLVGTTVKPFADEAKVSHEEMSYIVDSTASPIASVLAFNAWPVYVQSLIFVPGVAFLATESDRIRFFFTSIPFSFYGILAVLGTLLLCFNVTWHCGSRIRTARLRALNTGRLDAKDANPIHTDELQKSEVPNHYSPSVYEFAVPLVTLIAIAVGTFITLGSPKVNWAFATALCLSCVMALSRGMTLDELLGGIGNGLKSVVVASVLLVLAITIGGINKEIGGGLFLIDLLDHQIAFWMLPVILQILTMIIAFSTGTSWGTYAIAFPLAMPLAWAIGINQEVAHPEIFMAICFATVLNGSVYGDQCSPISDTTILSAMTTGCDLMDHVKSQIIPASIAATCAAMLWTLSALLLV